MRQATPREMEREGPREKGQTARADGRDLRESQSSKDRGGQGTEVPQLRREAAQGCDTPDMRPARSGQGRPRQRAASWSPSAPRGRSRLCRPPRGVEPGGRRAARWQALAVVRKGPTRESDITNSRHCGAGRPRSADKHEVGPLHARSGRANIDNRMRKEACAEDEAFLGGPKPTQESAVLGPKPQHPWRCPLAIAGVHIVEQSAFHEKRLQPIHGGNEPHPVMLHNGQDRQHTV